MISESTVSDILLVEDEYDIRELLTFTLERAGFQVTEAEDANRALIKIRDKMPDLVLVDWMLPGMSGRHLVTQLRADPATQNLPIIMLTAKSEETDKLEGFTAGVDDYITKPFNVSELTARIKALLRRSGNSQSEHEQLRFGDLLLDTVSHRLIIGGKTVDIGPTEYKLLKLLANNPNRAYSRRQLLREVWQRNFLEERTVDVHILRLRKILSPFGLDSWIETVRSIGYRFSPTSNTF